MQHDPVDSGELAHLLGGGVDRWLLIDMAVTVAGGVELGGEPLRFGCADAAADASLGAEGGEA